MIVKAITDLTDDIAALVQKSRDYQASLYPTESINQDDPKDLVSGDMYFIGVYQDEHLCGIGGVKIMQDTPNYGEIKNLYVDPVCRGSGVSKVIMNELEQFLIDNNVDLCRLETGVSQPESIGLYHRLGYQDREAYGSYEEDPFSVYMEKVIK